MSEYIFKCDPTLLLSSPTFSEASREELRVLLVLIATEGKAVSVEKVAEHACVSAARTKSAITLFTESNIVEQRNSLDTAEVVYEFDCKKDEKNDSSLEIARSIRDNNLHELQMECERLLGKSLSTYEIGTVTGMYTDKGISAQYILMLTSYLVETRPTVKIGTVARIADELLKDGIETLEELEVYIAEKSREVKGEMEMRNLLGIRGRSLTETERKYFRRWLHEFCYSTVIIGEAYDICVESTGGKSLKFMDTVLTAWHEHGCKTIDECRAQHEEHTESNKQKKKPKTKKSAAQEAKTPKYAEFDSEDALMRALERSYGDSSES